MFESWNTLVPGCVQSDVATISCIPAVFANFLSALLAFSGLTALIMFIMGALRLMKSVGDPKQVTSAVNCFKYGLVGISLVMGSFLLINIISQLTGIECLTKFGFGCK